MDMPQKRSLDSIDHNISQESTHQYRQLVGQQGIDWSLVQDSQEDLMNSKFQPILSEKYKQHPFISSAMDIDTSK